jgi:hypothetical protein
MLHDMAPNYKGLEYNLNLQNYYELIKHMRLEYILAHQIHYELITDMRLE